MANARRLSLRREALTELTTDETQMVIGGNTGLECIGGGTEITVCLKMTCGCTASIHTCYVTCGCVTA